MCYSGVPYWHDKRERRGRYFHVAREQVPARVSVASTGSRGAGGGGMRKVQCVCSPTHHPGSFRCRHHHSDYKWVARLGNKTNHLEVPNWAGNHEKRGCRGRFLPVVRAEVNAVSTGRIGGADGAGLRKVQCVCSPTIHPGSFRCRHHHADYKWVARQGNKTV